MIVLRALLYVAAAIAAVAINAHIHLPGAWSTLNPVVWCLVAFCTYPAFSYATRWRPWAFWWSVAAVGWTVTLWISR